MKRPIKFRGQLESGKFVYGDLTHEGDMVFVDDWQVVLETVAQLVGYDKDGREVYEGDVLVLNYGDKRYEYTARLQPCARNSDGLIHYSFETLSLKED